MQSEKVGRSEGVASLLTPPTIPPPVFFCTVEPSSAANQKSGSGLYTYFHILLCFYGYQVWSMHCNA